MSQTAELKTASIRIALERGGDFATKDKQCRIYIVFRVQNSRLVRKSNLSQPSKSTSNPEWNQKIELDIPITSDAGLEILAYEKGLLMDRFLGYAWIPLTLQTPFEIDGLLFGLGCMPKNPDFKGQGEIFMKLDWVGSVPDFLSAPTFEELKLSKSKSPKILNLQRILRLKTDTKPNQPVQETPRTSRPFSFSSLGRKSLRPQMKRQSPIPLSQSSAGLF
eukprot:TRINITY_DN11309_c0_g1_i1.p1 TRINITY_DN11309_c0_g1~~TRINITY_DN11309_c0_g1_i1.p1  ORF type:complete len:227 (-),score=37.39 TRINITY_DN11309_c0_g1_i1:70-729(-)